MPERVILHLDLDGLLQALEMRANPSLRGHRFVVGGLPTDPGVVIAFTKDLRRAGLRVQMPLSEAHALVPKALFLPSRPDAYAEAHEKVLQFLRMETPWVESFALTEYFLDAKERAVTRKEAMPWAESIRQSVKRLLGIDPAVGIAEDKLVARMCSGLARGGGVVTLAPGEFRDAFWSRPLEQLWAVGPRTLRSLRDLGMATIGDLAQTDPETLGPFFGPRVKSLIEMAHGRSTGEVTRFENEPRGPFLSRGLVYDAPVGARTRLQRQVERLCEQLAEALIVERRTTRRLELVVVWEDFTETTRRARLDDPTTDAPDLFRWAEALFRRFDLGGSIRRIEIVASELAPAKAGTSPPFVFAPPPVTEPVLPERRERRATAA